MAENQLLSCQVKFQLILFIFFLHGTYTKISMKQVSLVCFPPETAIEEDHCSSPPPLLEIAPPPSSPDGYVVVPARHVCPAHSSGAVDVCDIHLCLHHSCGA